MIELDMALGFARMLAIILGALGMVAGVTWCAYDTAELLRTRKGRKR